MRTLLLLCLFSSSAAAQTVYVVRHAERQDDSKDTALSQAGLARAVALRETLKAQSLTKVFITHYRRTQQTAAPVLLERKLTPIVLQADQTRELIDALSKLKPTDNALVVGHSDTVPEIIAALSGDKITIAHTEYDKLFVLKRADTWKLERRVYGPDAPK
jgi:broad specificity phosphatase PhoE